MSAYFQHRGIRWGTAVAAGLFSGRILSEQIAAVADATNLLVALLITLMAIVAADWWVRERPLSQVWPLFLLLLYVFYPEPNPRVAAMVAALALITWVQFPGNRCRAVARESVAAVIGLLLVVGFWLLYLATIAPDVLPADSGELQLVAAKLGVAHPPGFPLYTLLAHLTTYLPLVATPAYKVSLFSTITSAFTLALVYATVYHLTHHYLASITAVIALGTATTFWAQATTANIRSLTGLFTALAFFLLLRLFEARRQSDTTTKTDRSLALLALVLSLGLSHHASLAFMGVVMALFVLGVVPGLATKPRRWWRPLLAVLIGLLPWLYLPWRAQAAERGATYRGASPALKTVDGFLDHVLARGFRGDFFYFVEPALLWERLKVMGNVMTFQFSPWLLLGMIMGIWLLWQRNRPLAWLLGGSFAIHTFITATYRAPQTVEYMLPAYVPAVLCLGYAAGCFASSPPTTMSGGRLFVSVIAPLLTAVWLVTAIGQGYQRYFSYAILHSDTSSRDYAQNLLEQAPPDSVILADWHWATPLWYLQEVEGQRPDVTVHFVFPTAEPYAVTWANRIAGELETHAVIATHFDEVAYAQLPVPEPIDDAFLFRREPRTRLPEGYLPLDLVLGNSVHVAGYHLSSSTVEAGQEMVLTLAWRPLAGFQSTASLFSHLVGYDGRLYAQQDVPAQPQPEGITLTQFRLTPRLEAAPGDFAVAIGTYTAAELSSQPGETRSTIATITVTPMSRPPVTFHPIYRPIPGERPLRRLIGYDWDNTLPNQRRLYLHWQTDQGYLTEVHDNSPAESLNLPPYAGPWGVMSRRWSLDGEEKSHYVPLGQGIVWSGSAHPISVEPVPTKTIYLPQTFSSSRPVTRDLVVSVRLVGYTIDGFHWAWWDLDDSIPAMGAIPTLKWIEGVTVRSAHWLVVDPTATPGQTGGVLLRLYDAFTTRPLPILDERITAQFPWVPVGQIIIH